MSGRPRDERITEAVLRSTRELLGEAGYHGLTVEGLAAHAETTKAAIRRRWPSLKHVVVAAMTEDDLLRATPDTGCAHCDLLVLVEELRLSMDDVLLGRILPPLLIDLADDDDLRQDFLASFWKPRRERSDRVLERGVARGELRADLDFALAQDLVAGAVVYRFLFAHAELDLAVSERIVEYVMRGIGERPSFRCTET